jgi:hypothetical protein
MPNMNLAALANHTIAIEVEFNGQVSMLRGVATFEQISDLGPSLRIHVPDPAGDFDVILDGRHWHGRVFEDASSGCDYCISLSPADLCVTG